MDTEVAYCLAQRVDVPLPFGDQLIQVDARLGWGQRFTKVAHRLQRVLHVVERIARFLPLLVGRNHAAAFRLRLAFGAFAASMNR